MEREFWGFKWRQAEGLFTMRFAPNVRAYLIFTSKENARQFVRELCLNEPDGPEVEEAMLAGLRPISPGEIFEAANVALDPLLTSQNPVTPIRTWGDILADAN